MAETKKEENAPVLSEDDEDSEEEMDQIELDNNLLEAAKNNSITDCEQWLDRGGNPEYELEGWNAVLWAACNGNEQLLRVLHSRGALNQYIGEPMRSSGEDEE